MPPHIDFSQLLQAFPRSSLLYFQKLPYKLVCEEGPTQALWAEPSPHCTQLRCGERTTAASPLPEARRPTEGISASPKSNLSVASVCDRI